MVHITEGVYSITQADSIIHWFNDNIGGKYKCVSEDEELYSITFFAITQEDCKKIAKFELKFKESEGML